MGNPRETDVVRHEVQRNGDGGFSAYVTKPLPDGGVVLLHSASAPHEEGAREALRTWEKSNVASNPGKTVEYNGLNGHQNELSEDYDPSRHVFVWNGNGNFDMQLKPEALQREKWSRQGLLSHAMPHSPERANPANRKPAVNGK